MRRLVIARLLATYAVALTPGLRPRQPPRGATRLASTPTTDAEKAYFEKQDTVYDVDEGAWKNDAFWAQVDAELPGWRTDAALERFRGFCENLRTKPPGAGPAPRPSVGGRRRAPTPSRPGERESRRRRCLLYTSPSPRDRQKSRMPSSA